MVELHSGSKIQGCGSVDAARATQKFCIIYYSIGLAACSRHLGCFVQITYA